MATVRFDAFLIVYHRPSGQTHLLSEPAPEMLAALAAGEGTLDEITRRLGDSYDLADFSPALLAERLDELVASGLVEQL